jgi:two-component system nitrate/nitrite response regulator NarL
MDTRIRVVVVDDHPLFRDGVVHTLSATEEFLVVGTGSSADEAIRLVHELEPDVLLLDLKLPGGGLEAVNTIAAGRPVTKIVMLTIVDDQEVVANAFKRGARGYLLKEAGGNELKETVRLVARGEPYVSPQLVTKLLERMWADRDNQSSSPDGSLEFTEREEQVLSFLSRGLSNKEIAFRMSLSEKPVKYYITHVLRKLRVRNRVEAAIFASHRGPVSPVDVGGVLA